MTRAKVVARPTPNVVSFSIANHGTEAFDPASGDYVPDETFVEFRTGRPGLFPAMRSNPGWSCFAGERLARCVLDHAIPAGGRSLPVEIEVTPAEWVTEGAASFTDFGEFAAGLFPTAIDPDPTDGTTPMLGLPIAVPPDLQPPIEGKGAGVLLQWAAGAGGHVRGPAIAGASSSTVLAEGESADLAFAITSQDEISTGPYSPVPDFVDVASVAGGRASAGNDSNFPNASLAFNVPAGAEIVGPVRWFQLLPENTREQQTRLTGRSILDPQARFGEVPFQVGTETPGQFKTVLPSGTRFLPDNPVRIVATVKLASGSDQATITAEASAPDGVAPVASAGRALLTEPAAATASITLSRKVVAVTPTPTPTPTPAPAVVPTPAPAAAGPVRLPEPDQGAVLGERVGPRLVGKATFKKKSIDVGSSTTLDVTVKNDGDTGSDAGRVCVRISSAIVVVKVPKGVTSKGSVLCAKRSAIAVDGSQLAIKGLVVRGVTATKAATASDGGNDGVEMTGDRLAIRQTAGRRGGVTG